MLDELLKVAALQLGIAGEEIDRWRSEIEQELHDNLGAHHQPIRQRQLGSPTSSSTPIDQQITSSEQRYWKIWQAALPQLKAVVPILLALAEQKLRTDLLYTARGRQREQKLTGAGMQRGYVLLCDALKSNGATHTKAEQLKEEEVAILSDLICWKEFDPCYGEPGNPWLAIRKVYAERTLAKIGTDGRPPRKSQPGRPPVKRYTPTSADYWRFGSDDEQADQYLDATIHELAGDVSVEADREPQQLTTIFDQIFAQQQQDSSLSAGTASENKSDLAASESEVLQAPTPSIDETMDHTVNVPSTPTPPTPTAPERRVSTSTYRGGGLGDLIRRPTRNGGPGT